ncbi:hypothetical protein [Desulfosediminicola sp.]|uniref:hypothetical protein n=1 Tax=Desulfosediminicola sp. TaxID=2886825 RepID=UPI003AF203AD
MQKIVKELQQHVPFKDTTEIGDIVLIAAKEPQMLMYAKVTDIERDPSRKDEWWHVHFSVLSIPLQNMVWTLRTSQMTGEIFTMGGEERFVQAIDFQAEQDEETPEPDQETGTPEMKKPAGKIHSLKRVK